MANLTQLHALSPLDGRYQPRLSSLQHIFSEFGLINYRVRIEIAYLIAFLEETKLADLSAKDKKNIHQIGETFDELGAVRIKELEAECHHDVKAVEYFLQEQFKAQGLTQYIPFIHIGLTSEDINSCAYGVSLVEARDKVLLPALEKLLTQLLNQAEESAQSVMLARTHGQPAVPTTLGKELIVYAVRLEKELIHLRNTVIEAKLNGAVGNWNALQFVLPEIDWPHFSARFIDSLGLKQNPATTQIVPVESYSELFQCLVRVNGILIDCSRDYWQYVSDGYLIQKVAEKEVGSSTMPHKVNPIDFENCEGNAGVAIALLQHFVEKLPISRLQRDLSDSTVKRTFGVAFGHSQLALDSLTKGLTKVSPNAELMRAKVNEHREVLSEAFQTALRLSGKADAYDQIKKSSRGKSSTEFDSESAVILITDKKLNEKSQHLTPEKYIGLAAAIVSRESNRIKKLVKERQ